MISHEIFGEGLSLVLLHGWGFDKHIWTPLLPYLSNNNFQVYIVDLPGFGQTKLMDWDTFKNQLLCLLPANFLVLGWSLGGLFATRLAIEAPHRVLKFINVTSSPRFLEDTEWIGIDGAVLNDFHAKFKQDPVKTQLNFINSQLQFAYSVEFQKPSIEGLDFGLKILKSWDLRTPLLTVKTPGIFIFGRLDKIVNHQVMPIMQKKYPNFTYAMIKKSAHMPFLSNLDEFLKIIIDFVSN